MSLSNENLKKLEKIGYRFVGTERHAAAKVCHWTKKSILDEGECYKQKFYGIDSHRCLQMSPSIPFCHQKCLFCWRDVSVTETEWKGSYDEPGEIIDGCIDAQRNLLCGFFGNEKSNKKKLDESQDPKHAAISLAGEPMIYPKINDLIEEFHRRKFTTFLVTNGMTPEKLANLKEEPTQLYISLDAPNKKIFEKLCIPQIDNGWDNLNKSLDLLSSFKCRKVLRMTCVKDYNMQNVEEYADIIKRSNPDFVEVKAYMYVGESRKRLKWENMPSNQEIYDFAEDVAKECGLEVKDRVYESRVVLLA
ncbi:MAG: 4-demethylwyosine synthase TYW1 [Methanobacterium sp.]|uniref:4-demethylwyosine synthase TYW1 n=1 Tax=Methanobacterium sp. TaxID=2164 RepID=UPI003D65637D|nr:4-demethylwyosine synthase TYW1 [Methanobacterium sp.]